MGSAGLRSLLSGLRTALSSDSPASRLQLSITNSQPALERPSVVDAPPAGPDGGAAVTQPPAAPQEPLASGGGSSPQSPPRQSAAASSPAGALQAGGAADVAADVAAAAEHHRLTNLTSSIDLRAAALALERGLPYITLLLVLFLSSHVVGLSVYAYLSLVLFRLNILIRSQVALKQDRQARPLLTAAGVAALQLPLVLGLLRGQDLAGNLVMHGSRQPTKFWEVLFAVAVGDTLLRFLAVLTKVCVLLWMGVDSPARFRRRGHVLTAVDYCWGCYRLLPPAPLWYHFFNHAAVGSILQTGLSGAYLLVKAQHFFERAALAVLAVRQVAARGYGGAPTADEVQEAGNSCPICQDLYRDPVKLACGHIFCTDCCSEWFERERSCPMCRAAVGPANKKFKSAADGRTSLLPVVF